VLVLMSDSGFPAYIGRLSRVRVKNFGGTKPPKRLASLRSFDPEHHDHLIGQISTAPVRAGNTILMFRFGYDSRGLGMCKSDGYVHMVNEPRLNKFLDNLGGAREAERGRVGFG